VADGAVVGPVRRPVWRAGAGALAVFVPTLDAKLVLALRGGPVRLRDLRHTVGAPPQTTLRKRLSGLAEAGLVERRRVDSFPGTQEVTLTEAGRASLPVAEAVRVWLARCPDGPIELGTMASRAALGALVEGWTSLVVRVLAGRPSSLTELDRLIDDFNYPSLERRLDSLRVMGLIEACAERGRSTPYMVTPWLRSAVAPLIAAASWERLTGHAPAGRVRPRDIEAVLLLAAPLLRLDRRRSGSCRINMVMDGGRGAGATFRFDRGRLVSCTTTQPGSCSASIDGTIDTWLGVLSQRDGPCLRIAGDRVLAREVTAAALRSFASSSDVGTAPTARAQNYPRAKLSDATRREK
jgi:DNA-binding HxlR family transcriptional regulator